MIHIALLIVSAVVIGWAVISVLTVLSAIFRGWK